MASSRSSRVVVVVVKSNSSLDTTLSFQNTLS